MSEELTLALVAILVPIFAAISSLVTFLVTTRLRQRTEWREGGEKAYEKAIEILKGRFDRANDDPKERTEIERQLRGVKDDYLPYRQKKAADVSRDVVDKLAPAGAIAPDMPALSPSDREALERAAATIADLDPPKVADDFIILGNAFYAAEQFDKALEHYDRSLELRPDDPTTLNNRGLALTRLQRYDEALADFDHARELRPEDHEILYNRACVLSLMGRLSEGLDALKSAILASAECRLKARDDDDLQKLRADPKLGPEFERLVAKPEGNRSSATA